MARIFEIGDRVRVTDAYCRAHPGSKARCGVVVGKGRLGAWLRVHFDGFTRPVSLARAFLEHDAEVA